MRKRVLVAEDFDDIRQMMKILLECHGYEVVEAADGYEAVRKAVSSNPDLILMDIAMPVMDGIQATQAIRKHDGLTHRGPAQRSVSESAARRCLACRSLSRWSLSVVCTKVDTWRLSFR